MIFIIIHKYVMVVYDYPSKIVKIGKDFHEQMIILFLSSYSLLAAIHPVIYSCAWPIRIFKIICQV